MAEHPEIAAARRAVLVAQARLLAARASGEEDPLRAALLAAESSLAFVRAARTACTEEAGKAASAPAGIVVKAATAFGGSMFKLIVRAESDIAPAVLADVASRVGAALATAVSRPTPAPAPPPSPPPAAEIRITRILDGRYGVSVQRAGGFYSNYAYVDESRLMTKVLPDALDDLREISPVDDQSEKSG